MYTANANLFLYSFNLEHDLDLALAACIMLERCKRGKSKWEGYFLSLHTQALDTPLGRRFICSVIPPTLVADLKVDLMGDL